MENTLIGAFLILVAGIAGLFILLAILRALGRVFVRLLPYIVLVVIIVVVLNYFGVFTQLSSNDLDVRGSPSLTADFIDHVLQNHGSPAAGTGKYFVKYSEQFGIDDAVPLGFFWNESNFGIKGEATGTKSIGNIRCLASYPCPDGYSHFPSWEVGIYEWYKLISSYYLPEGRNTVGTILLKYAPKEDHNDPLEYKNTVITAVKNWRGGNADYP